MDIVENGSMVTLPGCLVGASWISGRDAEFDRQVSELHIKMGKKTDLITSLSGGNQQKVVLAKWLSAHPQGASPGQPHPGRGRGRQGGDSRHHPRLAGWRGRCGALQRAQNHQVCDRA